MMKEKPKRQTIHDDFFFLLAFSFQTYSSSVTGTNVILKSIYYYYNYITLQTKMMDVSE